MRVETEYNFDSIEERDRFVDATFPRRFTAEEGNVPGFYKLPGDQGHLGIMATKVTHYHPEEDFLPPAKVKTLYCSFCGKPQHECDTLVAGPGTFICDACVVLCQEIIDDKNLPPEGETE